MSKDVPVSDLKEIIHELMIFIVNAKKYVDPKKHDAYIVDYIQHFVKTMNRNNEIKSENLITDIMYRISKDLNISK